MKKLQLLSIDPGFSWRPIKLDQSWLAAHTIAKNNENYQGSDTYELVFLEHALRQLHQFIGWGRNDYPKNRVEQIGFLAGRHYEDQTTGRKYCVVDLVLPLHEARGSSAYIEYSAEMMNNASIRMDDYNLTQEDPIEMIGWFHTHPNSLPTFMSGTDMSTQRTIFNEDFHYSVVLNPHSRSWKAFRGPHADNSRCSWLNVSTIMPDAGARKPARDTAPAKEAKPAKAARDAKAAKTVKPAQTVQPAPKPAAPAAAQQPSHRELIDYRNTSAKKKARKKANAKTRKNKR